MEEALLITTTTDKKEIADRIGKHLVGRRLASCVQIVGPIKSIYRWKQTVEESDEWLCLIKSRASLYKKIEQEIVSLHPYEVPEIIALKIERGSPAYMSWIMEETA